MNPTGLEFVFFFPAVFLAYWLGPRRAGWQNAVLLVASYLFYATWNPSLVWVIALATAVDYSVGLALWARPSGPEGTGEGTRPRPWRKVALAASIAFNVGLLGWFKYEGFFAESLNAILDPVGLGAPLPVLRLALPLGLSYYTLQKLAYVLDVYYERIPACRNPLTFATFVAFFPQLICGPITRARTMIPQFSQARRLTPGAAAGGGGAFLLGFFMKAYVADRLGAGYVDPVFADPGSYGVASHWVALVGYAVQLFCDFAGYSVLAIGVGRFFGVELPVNFDRPYLSRSMLEFWRRWHISLNTWLFDYLFAPLTTGRSWFRGRMEAGFLVTFLVSGLWHGAQWTFVLWGLLHGLALAVNHRWDEFYKGLCRKDRAWVARRRSAGYAAVAWVVTQVFFMCTLLPFRASSVGNLAEFARGLAGLGHGAQEVHLASSHLAFAALFMLGYHLVAVGRLRAVAAGFRALPAPVRGVAYGLVVVFLFIFVPVGPSTFVYAQF